MTAKFAAGASSRPALLFSLGAAPSIPPPALLLDQTGVGAGEQGEGLPTPPQSHGGMPPPCWHLRASPKSLKSHRGEESQQRRRAKHRWLTPASSLTRHPRDVAQGWRGAHRHPHPASHCAATRPLPAPAPVGAALSQPQLLEAASAPSTCQPQCLQEHLGAGTRFATPGDRWASQLAGGAPSSV